MEFVLHFSFRLIDASWLGAIWGPGCTSSNDALNNELLVADQSRVMLAVPSKKRYPYSAWTRLNIFVRNRRDPQQLSAELQCFWCWSLWLMILCDSCWLPHILRHTFEVSLELRSSFEHPVPSHSWSASRTRPLTYLDSRKHRRIWKSVFRPEIHQWSERWPQLSELGGFS